MSTQISMLGGIGIINNDDVKDFNDQVKRVYRLMSDGNWHTRDEIEIAAGGAHGRAAEGIRRMRQLRTKYVIERQRIPETREFAYRLTFKRNN